MANTKENTNKQQHHQHQPHQQQGGMVNSTMMRQPQQYSKRAEGSTLSSQSPPPPPSPSPSSISNSSSRRGAMFSTKRKNIKLSKLYPFIGETYCDLRKYISNIGNDVNSQILTEIINKYRKGCNEVHSDALEYSEVSRMLSANIVRVLDLLKDMSATCINLDEYHHRVCELIAIFISCELRVSVDANEDEHLLTASRIVYTMRNHLTQDDEEATRYNILRTLVYIPRFFNAREIMCAIFESLIPLKAATEVTQLSDKLYMLYIIVFYRWMLMQKYNDGQQFIVNFAEGFMKPKVSLCTNMLYCQHLARYTRHSAATRTILNDMKFYTDLRNACIIDNAFKVSGSIVLNLCEDDDVIELNESEVLSFAELFSAVQLESTKTSVGQIKREQKTIVDSVDLTVDDDDEHSAAVRSKLERHEKWLENFELLAKQYRELQERQERKEKPTKVICLDSDTEGDEVEEVPTTAKETTTSIPNKSTAGPTANNSTTLEEPEDLFVDSYPITVTPIDCNADLETSNNEDDDDTQLLPPRLLPLSLRTYVVKKGSSCSVSSADDNVYRPSSQQGEVGQSVAYEKSLPAKKIAYRRNTLHICSSTPPTRRQSDDESSSDDCDNNNRPRHSSSAQRQPVKSMGPGVPYASLKSTFGGGKVIFSQAMPSSHNFSYSDSHEEQSSPKKSEHKSKRVHFDSSPMGPTAAYSKQKLLANRTPMPSPNNSTNCAETSNDNFQAIVGGGGSFNCGSSLAGSSTTSTNTGSVSNVSSTAKQQEGHRGFTLKLQTPFVELRTLTVFKENQSHRPNETTTNKPHYISLTNCNIVDDFVANTLSTFQKQKQPHTTATTTRLVSSNTALKEYKRKIKVSPNVKSTDDFSFKPPTLSVVEFSKNIKISKSKLKISSDLNKMHINKAKEDDDKQAGKEIEELSKDICSSDEVNVRKRGAQIFKIHSKQNSKQLEFKEAPQVFRNKPNENEEVDREELNKTIETGEMKPTMHHDIDCLLKTDPNINTKEDVMGKVEEDTNPLKSTKGGNDVVVLKDILEEQEVKNNVEPWKSHETKQNGTVEESCGGNTYPGRDVTKIYETNAAIITPDKTAINKQASSILGKGGLSKKKLKFLKVKKEKRYKMGIVEMSNCKVLEKPKKLGRAGNAIKRTLKRNVGYIGISDEMEILKVAHETIKEDNRLQNTNTKPLHRYKQPLLKPTSLNKVEIREGSEKEVARTSNIAALSNANVNTITVSINDDAAEGEGCEKEMVTNTNIVALSYTKENNTTLSIKAYVEGEHKPVTTPTEAEDKNKITKSSQMILGDVEKFRNPTKTSSNEIDSTCPLPLKKSRLTPAELIGHETEIGHRNSNTNDQDGHNSLFSAKSELALNQNPSKLSQDFNDEQPCCSKSLKKTQKLSLPTSFIDELPCSPCVVQNNASILSSRRISVDAPVQVVNPQLKNNSPTSRNSKAFSDGMLYRTEAISPPDLYTNLLHFQRFINELLSPADVLNTLNNVQVCCHGDGGQSFDMECTAVLVYYNNTVSAERLLCWKKGMDDKITLYNENINEWVAFPSAIGRQLEKLSFVLSKLQQQYPGVEAWQRINMALSYLLYKVYEERRPSLGTNADIATTFVERMPENAGNQVHSDSPFHVVPFSPSRGNVAGVIAAFGDSAKPLRRATASTSPQTWGFSSANSPEYRTTIDSNVTNMSPPPLQRASLMNSFYMANLDRSPPPLQRGNLSRLQRMPRSSTLLFDTRAHNQDVSMTTALQTLSRNTTSFQDLQSPNRNPPTQQQQQKSSSYVGSDPTEPPPSPTPPWEDPSTNYDTYRLRSPRSMSPQNEIVVSAKGVEMHELPPNMAQYENIFISITTESSDEKTQTPPPSDSQESANTTQVLGEDGCGDVLLRNENNNKTLLNTEDKAAPMAASQYEPANRQLGGSRTSTTNKVSCNSPSHADSSEPAVCDSNENYSLHSSLQHEARDVTKQIINQRELYVAPGDDKDRQHHYVKPQRRAKYRKRNRKMGIVTEYEDGSPPPPVPQPSGHIVKHHNAFQGQTSKMSCHETMKGRPIVVVQEDAVDLSPPHSIKKKKLCRCSSQSTSISSIYVTCNNHAECRRKAGIDSLKSMGSPTNNRKQEFQQSFIKHCLKEM